VHPPVTDAVTKPGIHQQGRETARVLAHKRESRNIREIIECATSVASSFGFATERGFAVSNDFKTASSSSGYGDTPMPPAFLLEDM
jgi:hypothetical protein